MSLSGTVNTSLSHFSYLEPLFLIDLAVIGDRVASTAKTERRQRFRTHINGRDQTCIFTETELVVCEATHIIPVCMSDAVIYFPLVS